MRHRTLLSIVLLAGTSLSCERPGEDARQRFVRLFLESVRDDTAFFGRYVTDREPINALRRRYATVMTGSFRVLRHEDYGDGTYDYVAQCGEGLACTVYIKEDKGKIVSAELAIQ